MRSLRKSFLLRILFWKEKQNTQQRWFQLSIYIIKISKHTPYTKIYHLIPSIEKFKNNYKSRSECWHVYAMEAQSQLNQPLNRSRVVHDWAYRDRLDGPARGPKVWRLLINDQLASISMKNAIRKFRNVARKPLVQPQISFLSIYSLIQPLSPMLRQY